MMTGLTTKIAQNLTKVVVGAVVLAVVIGVAVYAFAGGSTKKVSAQFASAVGIYEGTPVDILGVPVGQVTKVTPSGTTVTIEMEYDSKYNVPADAISVIVANSLVSDRYIQLAPAYSGSGPILASGAQIPIARTASPAELDDIYSALDKLSTALGPNGANKDGSLNAFVKVAADNLKGNGAALGQSITALSQAATTLANGREDLFGTVKNLQAFTAALEQSDSQVRHFEEQLAQVAGDLADERADLGTALKTLGSALNSVAKFVKDNAAAVHTDISGLKDITNILVKQKASLNETLAIAPVALANIIHAYQPDLGVIGTRSNLGSLTDPGQLCTVINFLLDPLNNKNALVDKLLGPLTSTISSTCLETVKKFSLPPLQLPAGLSPAALNDLLNTLLGGGLGGLVGAGS